MADPLRIPSVPLLEELEELLARADADDAAAGELERAAAVRPLRQAASLRRASTALRERAHAWRLIGQAYERAAELGAEASAALAYDDDRAAEAFDRLLRRERARGPRG